MQTCVVNVEISRVIVGDSKAFPECLLLYLFLWVKLTLVPKLFELISLKDNENCVHCCIKSTSTISQLLLGKTVQYSEFEKAKRI